MVVAVEIMVDMLVKLLPIKLLLVILIISMTMTTTLTRMMMTMRMMTMRLVHCFGILVRLIHPTAYLMWYCAPTIVVQS